MAEALNIVYAAKKKAEVAPGVGQETDMYFLNKDGLVKIDENILSELKRIYEDVSRPISEEIKEKSNQLNGFIKKIEEENKKKSETVNSNDKQEEQQKNI